MELSSIGLQKPVGKMLFACLEISIAEFYALGSKKCLILKLTFVELFLQLLDLNY